MPKLLIVDDEETIRIGLKSMINRLLPRWEVVGCCEDAEQAWEHVNSSAPDLAIIDIGMTGMSGLELADLLEKHKPEVSKIMLTGYDKFSYVQSALRAGVADYLLKPVQRDELVQALHKVEEQLAERELALRLKLEKSIADWAVFQKVEGYGELAELLDAKGLSGPDVRFGIILQFQYGEHETAEDESGFSATRDWPVLAGHISSGIVTAVSVTISSVCEMIFIAVSGRPSIEERQVYGELGGNGSQAQLAPVGCSELIGDLQLLPVAFRQAQEMMFRHAMVGDALSHTDEAARLNMLSVSIEMNDLKHFMQQLEQWRLELRPAREHNPFAEFARLFRFIAFFAGLQSSRSQSALLAEMNAEISKLSGSLLFTGDPGALLSAIDRFIDRVAQYKPNLFEERKIIGKVKEVMRREFMNPDFSLEHAALSVHLNPTYLSELFKETTGRKFIDYLTDIRLDEARRILLETDMKMYEVCLSVGYTSSKYFSTLFRKKFGVTPTMYREGPSA